MKKQFFGAVAFVTALGAGFLNFDQTFAATDCSNISTQANFQTCLNNKENITLTADITTNNTLEYNQVDGDVTIDLNGHNVVNTTGSTYGVIFVKAGKLTLTGNGKIGSTSENTNALRITGSSNKTASDYSVVTVGEGVSLETGNGEYGIRISSVSGNTNPHGIKLNFGGKITAGGGIRISEKVINDQDGHPAEINILDGAKITATNNHAILALGHGNWNFGAAELKGVSGIGFKGGNFYFSGTNVVAIGNNNPTPALHSDSMENTGAAIQIDSVAGVTDEGEFYVHSGTFTSEKGYAIVENAINQASKATTVGKFTVHTGTFHGSQDFDDSVVTSSTGAFFWFHGDGCLLEDGSYVLELDYDTDYEHTMTVERYADVSGLDAIYADPAYEDLDRLLPVYFPLASLSDGEVEALASSEFAGSVAIRSFDLSLRMFLDEVAAPEPHMSRLFYPVGDTGEEYPVTFKMRFPEIDGVKNGYTREYYVLDFHLIDQRTGEYEIEKLPVEISEDGKTFTFSTRKFSTFALAYEDTAIPAPANEEEGEVEAPKTGFETNSEALTEKISSSTSSLGLTVAVVAVLSACFVGIKKLQKK